MQFCNRGVSLSDIMDGKSPIRLRTSRTSAEKRVVMLYFLVLDQNAFYLLSKTASVHFALRGKGGTTGVTAA